LPEKKKQSHGVVCWKEGQTVPLIDLDKGKEGGKESLRKEEQMAARANFFCRKREKSLSARKGGARSHRGGKKGSFPSNLRGRSAHVEGGEKKKGHLGRMEEIICRVQGGKET